MGSQSVSIRLGRLSSAATLPTSAHLKHKATYRHDLACHEHQKGCYHRLDVCCKSLMSIRWRQCLDFHRLVCTILTSLNANSSRSRIVVHELGARNWSAYVVGARVWQTLSRVVYIGWSQSVRTVFKYISPPHYAPRQETDPEIQLPPYVLPEHTAFKIVSRPISSDFPKHPYTILTMFTPVAL